MPNDMDREYNAWVGRRETKLRRPKYDCGCPNTGVVYYHLWCDRLACEKHADAPHDCGEFKGGIEKETAEPEAVPEVIVMPFEASTTVGTGQILDEQHTLTLAEMNAASAAVRARRATSLDADLQSSVYAHVEDLVERAEAEVSARFATDLPPGYTVTFDRTPLPPAWGMTAEQYVPWFDALRRANPSLGHPVTFATDVTADGSGAIATMDGDGRIHLAEVSPPVDAALPPEVQERIEENSAVMRLLGEPLTDDRPWWRRMLGGTR